MPAASLLLALAALPFAGDPLAPVLVHDRDERSPISRVEAFGRPIPGVQARLGGGPVAYRHLASAADGGSWRQYWLFFQENPQDRGIARTGRHEGDWELVQYRLDARGRPVEAVVAQHSGAERCPWREVRRRGGHPVVYLASASHAAYLRAGFRDRTWPDPNDEADGGGRVVRPAVQPVTERSPAWMRWPGRWGASRAAPWNPAEQDSPRGPVHQPARWDPERLARSAGPCRASCDRRDECDARETGLAAGAGGLGLLLLAGFARRRHSSPSTRG